MLQILCLLLLRGFHTPVAILPLQTSHHEMINSHNTSLPYRFTISNIGLLVHTAHHYPVISCLKLLSYHFTFYIFISSLHSSHCCPFTSHLTLLSFHFISHINKCEVWSERVTLSLHTLHHYPTNAHLTLFSCTSLLIELSITSLLSLRTIILTHLTSYNYPITSQLTLLG